MYLFSLLLRSACLYMRLSLFSLCLVSFTALRGFKRIRIFKRLFWLVCVNTRLRLVFAASFLFLLRFVYLFRISLS